MRRVLRPGRPRPAMVVAVAALFVALSGTTYAVTSLPKRSVGSLKLKRSAVRSENLAKGAVTRSKLGMGFRAARSRVPAAAPAAEHGRSLRADASYAARAGYADAVRHVDSTPIATRAKLADRATSATTAASVASATSTADTDRLDGKDSSQLLPKSTIVDIPRFSLGDDQTRTMLTIGPFKLTARCYINQLLSDDADVLISTTQAHSAFHGFSNDPDLNPGDPESGRSMIGVDGPTGLAQFESSARGTAVAPDGTEIRSIVLYVGVNLFGQLGRCSFGGLAIV